MVSKVYALLMWHFLPSSSAEKRELLTDVQDLEKNQNDFKYEETMVRISALGWSSDLRNLPEINFIQLYATSCWEERITGSTTEAIQNGLESEAKAVAL